jgi:predicted Zn-dependent peptidase
VFPVIRKSVVSMGLPLWHVPHAAVPVTTMVLLVRAGSSADPIGRPGLASLTGDMLDEGAGDRTAIEVHEALAGIGAQFDTEVGADATFLTLTMLSKSVDVGMALLADLAARPRFDDSEFTRVRELRANRLRQLRDVPSATADRAFATALYGTHPYGHLAIGTIDALDRMTADDVRRFHRSRYHPANAVLVVVGDEPHGAVVEQVERAFERWAGGGEIGGAVPSTPPCAPSDRLVLVNRERAPQSELRVGHLGVSRQTPDYHALVVANLVLGGQFVSRLNMNLREHRGLTYGARSWFEFRLGPGPFQMSASVQTPATADAIAEMMREVREMRGARPITQAELDTARATLTRGYPRNFETADQLARSVAQLALYDLPDDYFSRFVPTVAALGLADVQSAAAAHLDPDRLLAVIVGDTGQVAPSLAVLGLGTAVEVVPA